MALATTMMVCRWWIQNVAYLETQLPGVGKWVMQWKQDMFDFISASVTKFSDGSWGGSPQTLQNMVMELSLCWTHSDDVQNLEVRMGELLSQKSTQTRWAALMQQLQDLEAACADGDVVEKLSACLQATNKCMGMDPGDEQLHSVSLTWVLLRERQARRLTSGERLDQVELELMTKWSSWLPAAEKVNLDVLKEIESVSDALKTYVGDAKSLEQIRAAKGATFMGAVRALMRVRKAAVKTLDGGGEASKDLKSMLEDSTGQVSSRLLEAEKTLVHEVMETLTQVTGQAHLIAAGGEKGMSWAGDSPVTSTWQQLLPKATSTLLQLKGSDFENSKSLLEKVNLS